MSSDDFRILLPGVVAESQGLCPLTKEDLLRLVEKSREEMARPWYARIFIHPEKMRRD